MKLSELLNERLTAKHVVNRNDISAIISLISDKFGMAGNINNDVGLCFLSQAAYTLQAILDVSQDELDSYFMKLTNEDGKVANNVGDMVKAINKTPITIKGKKKQLTLNAHKITTAEELKRQVSLGQPTICAYGLDGTIGKVVKIIESINKNYKGKGAKYFNHMPSERRSKLTDQIIKDLENGFISQEAFDLGHKGGLSIGYYGEPDNDRAWAYHATMCFGYEAGDKAFLFREPRHSYARKGYFKVAESIITSKNIGVGKGGFHGMFYIEVMDVKDVEGGSNE